MFSALCHADIFFKGLSDPQNVPYRDFMVLSTNTKFILQAHSLFPATRRWLPLSLRAVIDQNTDVTVDLNLKLQ